MTIQKPSKNLLSLIGMLPLMVDARAATGITSRQAASNSTGSVVTGKVLYEDVGDKS